MSEGRLVYLDCGSGASGDMLLGAVVDLGLPIEKLFVEFSQRPVAAASIGQVHEAVLPNDRRVAVKVQRPNAPKQIEADLSLLYQAARITKERRNPWTGRACCPTSTRRPRSTFSPP